jgi:hypothetical protein
MPLVIGFSCANAVKNKQVLRKDRSLHIERQNNSNFEQTMHLYTQPYTTDILGGFLQGTYQALDIQQS